MLRNFLDKFHQQIRKTYVLAFKEYKKTLGILLFFLLLALSQIPNLKFLVMMSDLLDSDFETHSQFRTLNDNFVEENQVSAFISSSSGVLSFDQHCLVIHWLNKVHLDQSRIAKISSAYGLKKAIEGERSIRVEPVLIPDCSQVLTEKEISNQMQQISDSPSGHILTNHLRTDVFASFYLRNLEQSHQLGHFDKSAFEDLEKSFEKYVGGKDKRIQVSWAGIGTYQYYLQKAYEQMNILNLITGLVLLLSFKLFFRSWKSGFILMSTYTVATIFLYGFMGSMGFPVDSLSAAVPIMLLIATLEDFVFFLLIYEKGGSIQSAFQKILIPSFYTSLTTCLGFSSLMLSDLSIIRRFGFICAVGAMIEWILIFLVLPKLLTIWKKRTNNYLKLCSLSPWAISLSQKLTQLNINRKVGIICLLPIIYFACNYNKDLIISDSPEGVFPSSHPIPIATEKLVEGRGWKSEVSLVFLEEVDEEIVAKIKLKNSAFIASESYKDVKQFLMKDLNRASSKRYFERNLRYVDLSDRWIGEDRSLERVLLYTSTTDVVEMNKIRDSVNEICNGECYLANILVSYSEFGVKVLKTLGRSFMMSLSIILVVLIGLCFYFRINHKVYVVLTALWGPITLMSLFQFFDIGIYFATSVVMSVLVGLAGDNVFQFIFAKKKSTGLTSGVESLGNASFISLLLMMIVSSTFLFSDFEGVRKIGLMMIIGFVLGWIGDYLILKSLLNRKTKS